MRLALRHAGSVHGLATINGLIDVNVPSTGFPPVVQRFGNWTINTHLATDHFSSGVTNSDHGPVVVQSVSGFADRVSPPATNPPVGFYGAENINGPVGTHATTGWSSPVVPESNNWRTDAHFPTDVFSPNVTNFDCNSTDDHFAPGFTDKVHSHATSPDVTVNGAGASLFTSTPNDYSTATGSVQPLQSASNPHGYITVNGVEASPFALTPNGATTTTESAQFASNPHGYIADTAPALFASNPSLAPAADDSRHVCLHPGCTGTFKRAAELERHMKKHRPGLKDFDCPAPGCSRKGTRGFTRKDKMLDHWKCKHQ